MGVRPELLSTSDVIMPSELPKIPYDRVPPAFEMAVSLFENCNLRCKFCFEGLKQKRIDKEYINKICFLIKNHDTSIDIDMINDNIDLAKKLYNLKQENCLTIIYQTFHTNY